MTRSPHGAGFDYVFDRNRPAFILASFPDDVIDAAADALIEPNGVMSMADQGAAKSEIDKKIKALKKTVFDKIPADILGPLGLEDFFRSDVWEAFVHWLNLAGMMTRACDPYGQLCGAENPYFSAFDYLGLKAGGDDARFQPASYDPSSFRLF